MNLGHLIKKYRWNFLLMLFLVLVDAGLLVLFPLFIGYAIDDALVSEYRGTFLLGALGISTLLIGAGRRFYDSRFYAGVYEQLGVEVGRRPNQSASTKSAHLGFLGEVVEFFENSMPEIINNTIGLVGTLVIIATMDVRMFFGCLSVLVVVSIVYGLTEKKTIRFNASYNSELEKQVGALSGSNPVQLRWHLQKLMKWNVKLSDLETINFSVIWLFMMAFLVASIVSSVVSGMVSQGTLFALVLYLFQFIENVTIMPLYYQQWLRLKEIIDRMNRI
ncbi:MAG: ABC transporter six-transmembrane domain-containing protein [Cyclobacteriaceae bacterium]